MPPLTPTDGTGAIMRDRGARNLVVLVCSVCVFLIIFFLFLAVQARMWTPYWAVHPTTAVPAEKP
ncbi:MAG: hypothetical protein AAB152_05410 [Candidatus Coatesbacteria bacterium]